MIAIDRVLMGVITLMGVGFWIFWIWFFDRGIYELNGVTR